MTISRKSSDHF